jgi:hypothetical protein
MRQTLAVLLRLGRLFWSEGEILDRRVFMHGSAATILSAGTAVANINCGPFMPNGVQFCQVGISVTTETARQQKYPTSNTYYDESSHLLTEIFWAQTEGGVRQCDYAKSHIENAQRHLSALKFQPGPGTDNFAGQFDKAQIAVMSCIP